MIKKSKLKRRYCFEVINSSQNNQLLLLTTETSVHSQIITFKLNKSLKESSPGMGLNPPPPPRTVGCHHYTIKTALLANEDVILRGMERGLQGNFP